MQLMKNLSIVDPGHLKHRDGETQRKSLIKIWSLYPPKGQFCFFTQIITTDFIGLFSQCLFVSMFNCFLKLKRKKAGRRYLFWIFRQPGCLLETL
jgi:hypothetical protein